MIWCNAAIAWPGITVQLHHRGRLRPLLSLWVESARNGWLICRSCYYELTHGGYLARFAYHRIERMAFVATKADHVPAMRRANLRNLLRGIVEMAAARLDPLGVIYHAVASILSTTDRKQGRLASAGWSDGMIGGIEWSGVSLDSEVSVTYGEWVRRTFEAKTLVGISADVYFRLKGDFAKAWWPFVDSQPDHSWVSLETLSELVGRDYRTEDSKRRARFREDVQAGFQDMIRAGGISNFEIEARGPGRTKAYRVLYTHALPKVGQLELAIDTPSAV